MDLEIKDFTGGLTDEPNTAQPNQYAKAENIIMNREGNPCSRFGSVCYDVSNSRLPTGNQRVGTLINYNKDTALLAQSATHLYRYSSGWSEILGPSSAAAFPTITTANYMSYAEWKKHLIICFDAQIPPIIVYPDQGGTYRAVTAGLPALPTPDNFVSATILAQAIALANALRTAELAHFANASLHRAADSVATALLTAPVATDLATLLTLTGQLLKSYAQHFADYVAVSQFHYNETDSSATIYVAQPADQRVDSVVTPTTLQEAAVALNGLKEKWNTHDGNDDAHNHALGPSAGTYQGKFGLYQVSTVFVDNAPSGPYAALDEQFLYRYANLIKSSLHDHMNDGGSATTPHSTAADTANATAINALPSATTWETLEGLVSDLRHFYSFHEVDAALTSAWSYHVAHESGSHQETPPYQLNFFAPPFPDQFGGVRSKNVSGLLAGLNRLRTVATAHMEDLAAHYTTNPTTGYIAHLIPSQDVLLATYAYALVPLYTYNVGSVEFQVRGTPIYFQAADVISIESSPLVIHSISTISNASNTIYDTSNIDIEIYRTTDGGDTYYLVDTIDNGTTTYTDYFTDNLIQSRDEIIYTAGGVVENDAPPSAKYIHVLGNRAYCLNFAEGGASYPNRLRHSLDGSIHSWPADFFVDLPNDGAGVSSFNDVVIAWTGSKQYRIAGSFDELGRGSMEAIPIADSVGLVASHSPIQTEQGVVFCGNDGFYITDGYTQKKINRDWLATYLGLTTSTKAPAIYGALDTKYRQIWWIMNAGSSDNDAAYLLDLNFPLTENSVFTSAVNSTHFAPTAICYFAGQIIRGDARGYVFKHDSSYTNDPRVDTGASASAWDKKAIVYDFITAAYDFGTTKLKKWVAQIMVRCRNLSNLSMQIKGLNDDGKSTQTCKTIRSRASSGLIQEKRHFPAGNLRCFSKQVEFTNANVILSSSDSLGQATVDPVGKTITILTGTWPSNLVDQTIALANDSYARQYTITAVSSTVLTVSDAGNHLPVAGNYKWELFGIPKDEKLQLLSFVMPYSVIGENQESKTSEVSGANA